MRQTALRLAIISVAGSCGWMAPMEVHAASCWNGWEDNFHFYSCRGSAGDSDHRDGETANNLNLQSSDNFTADSTMDLPSSGGPTLQPAGGVRTLYTDGGGGCDAGHGGAGAPHQMGQTGTL